MGLDFNKEESGVPSIRLFTSEEANGLITELTRLMVLLRDEKEEIEKREVQIDALELLVDEESESNRDALSSEIEGLNQAVTSFNRTVQELESHGCHLKDVDMGLVDFYSRVDGRVVYLCWKFGEREITHWHEVGEGYTSRQSL